jgi:hypothetical protein
LIIIGERFSPGRPLPWRRIMVDIEPALVASWGTARLELRRKFYGREGIQVVDKKCNFLSYDSS